MTLQYLIRAKWLGRVSSCPLSPSQLDETLESFKYYYPARMHRSKVICLSVCLLSSPRKLSDLYMQASEQLISITNQSKSVKNWLECVSTCLAQSTNVTNIIVLLAIIATPINRAHQHFLLMCITGLVEIVNITGLSLCRRLQSAQMLGVRGMCSRELQCILLIHTCMHKK